MRLVRTFLMPMAVSILLGLAACESASDDVRGSDTNGGDDVTQGKDSTVGFDDVATPGTDTIGTPDVTAPDTGVHDGLILFDTGHDTAQPDTAQPDTAEPPDPSDVEGDTTVPDATPADTVDPNTLPKFSFFVTSLASIVQLSGSSKGFGGDLRYGETGAGAGLRGADKICAEIAELSMPGASAKEWHAFLSATSDGNGAQVNAIDRIGQGPWYDRMGRLFANNLSELPYTRPTSANAQIKNDFPNEWGVTNHNPDLTGNVDNHDMLTGSDKTGKLYAANATCLDWTAATGNTTTEGKPRVGHSWPTSAGGMGGGATLPPAPPGGNQDMSNWISALTEAGCKAGINLIENGAGDQSLKTVGAGGGYGGFYCFAMVP